MRKSMGHSIERTTTDGQTEISEGGWTPAAELQASFAAGNPSFVIRMKKALSVIIWILVAALGAFAFAALAFPRGERVNSMYILTAALCTYAIGYRFYSKWIATRVLMLDDLRSTPCEVHEDGRDYVKTNKWIVFGHHFAAISGPGPLVGPVLAAQFGFLPGTLWILIGAVLGGAVQDFTILFCSIRRDGKSLGQMVKEELNTTAGAIALVAILGIMVILLAVLALVIVKALAESPWGVFTVGGRPSRLPCSWAGICAGCGRAKCCRSLSLGRRCCCSPSGADNSSTPTLDRRPPFGSRRNNSPG